MKRAKLGPLEDVQLWDGRNVWCRGHRDGLPQFGTGEAPSGLSTKRQLWDAGLRRRPRQDPVALLVLNHRDYGETIGELFRTDQALPKRQMTPRWRASLTQMYLAHCRCRRCGQEQNGYVSSRTWHCWLCMEATGDFGQPDGVPIAA